jgi:hypothetical protein
MPWSEAVSFAAWFLYACFFEWVLHRHFMHARRFPLQDAFRGHMEHHQIYRGDHRFQVEEGHPGEGIAMRWYAFPLILLGHTPVFALIQWATGLPTFWGALAACTTYFVGYEYTHYLMHAPLGHPVERFGWFRFMREHHRLHHRHMRVNYNVFIPLADVCLGTLRTKE